MDERDEAWARKIKFTYEDNEGDITSVAYTSKEENVSELYDLVEYFKRFLVAAGFATASANRVQYIEEEEVENLKAKAGFYPDNI
jgi:hypothetical protein